MTLVDSLVPDELWQRVEPLLPTPPRSWSGGRHRIVPDRNCLPQSCTCPVRRSRGGCCPSVTYTEGNAPVVVHSTITVADADSPQLVQATATITLNYVAGEDVLSFANTATITGSFASRSRDATAAMTPGVGRAGTRSSSRTVCP